MVAHIKLFILFPREVLNDLNQLWQVFWLVSDYGSLPGYYPVAKGLPNRYLWNLQLRDSSGFSPDSLLRLSLYETVNHLSDAKGMIFIKLKTTYISIFLKNLSHGFIWIFITRTNYIFCCNRTVVILQVYGDNMTTVRW